MTSLISVIVPIYNVEKYLSRCVDSIIKQSYKNLEIILVDDGSPDSCPQICDDYAKKDKRIIVIHKENGGLADARNAGMKAATGDFVSFIDSDDWIEPDMLSNMVSCAEKNDSDVVSGGVRWVLDDGNVLREEVSKTCITLNRSNAYKELLCDGLLKQHVWNKLYKHKLIYSIFFDKGKYHEDIFWSYKIFGKCKRVSVLSKCYYNYVQRSDSIMGVTYSEKRLDALDAMYKRCEYTRKEFPEFYDLALYVYMGSCMFHLQQAMVAGCTSDVKNNILKRLSFKKSGNVFNYVKGKQALWTRIFFICPKLTCKVRNILKIGI